MTLGDFIKVYGNDEPFWINYPDDTGFYDAMLFNSVSEYINALRNNFWQGVEFPFWYDDEVECLTHGGDGILTVELKYEEEV